MKRHHVAIFAILAMLAPQVAGALPHPPGGTQTEPETQVALFTLLGNDPVGQETPLLTSGRSYRFEVSGAWKPSGATNNFADAGFETTDGLNWSKTGKGLVVAATNYGSPSNPTLFSVRGDHKYSIPWTGRGQAELLRLNDPTGYSDNSGSVTVKLFAQNKVKWVYPINQPVTLGVPATPRVAVDTSPYAVTYTVTGTTIPTTTVQVDAGPPIGSIVLYFASACPRGFKEARLKVILGTATVADQSLGCYSDLGQAPSYTVPVGGKTPADPLVIGEISFCDPPRSPPCEIPIIPGFVLEVWPGSQPIDVLPPGSSAEVTLSWSADRWHMWKSFLDDQSGDYYVAPFNPLIPQERDWFQGEVAAGRLELFFSLTIYGPNRQPIATTIGHPLVRPVPGLGQVIESIFESRLQGQ